MSLWNSPAVWIEVNETIQYLIRFHRVGLKTVIKNAENIQEKLISLFPFLEELCSLTCPWCPDPCCSHAKVWIDFRDMVFLHLCKIQIPPYQLLDNMKKSCRYLGSRGCTLDRIMRPWICTCYLCPTQMNIVRKEKSSEHEFIIRIIEEIKPERKKIEEEFIKITS
jgi:hypothetical protein